MAQEIKNTFLKSKMNKDLDDRILPNGEYRDARNISVGRSEDNDVGALENIIGNDLVTGTDIGNGLTVIGIESDSASDKLFVFLTDYQDSDPKNPTNAPAGSKHYIYSYDNSNGNYKKLVQGEFLNFSKTNRIIGINLIEKLLFWTDNRNQPRKINIDLAVAFTPGGLATVSGDYYTEEHQISVAKYSPYAPIDLYNRIDLQVISGATLYYFEIAGHREIELKKYIGATVICTETIPPTQGSSHVKVNTVKNLPGPVTRITVSPDMPAAPAQNQFVSLISSTMSNKNNDDSWPGDPDFLEDKFVRFSYRFKFDDNEYSLMAPFTQIAYIPKQRGYFINGDENAAYQSTVVSFMENLVQNVGLVIPLPTSANRLVRDYKINEMEILFRESDGIAVKVLDSVSVGDISGASGIDSYYNYEYQSRKPYRTLPEAQTVRVYDKVPVRALAQESSGNRIIYGNFTDQYTPPANINYNCRIDPKSDTGLYNNFIEYPSHSVKRNRNYQIGFVLADKFGRQSPVILSSVDKGATSSTGSFFSGSTIYSPYDSTDTSTDVLSWNGDAIKVLVNEPISSKINYTTGTPGLYALKEQYSPNTGEGFAVNFWLGTQITNSSYVFRANTAFSNNQNIPRVDDYMRGAYQDFVKVTAISGPTGPNQYTVTTDGRVSDVYLTPKNLGAVTPDLKFVYSINDLGWYSYKIVVKQTEQDYYNVYLPGILNGYPGQSGKENVAPEQNVEGGIDEGVFPNEINLTAHTVLFNDNINKVPRDLAEVGPDQKQYRSSVVLYGRVTNLMEQSGAEILPNNQQYFPRLNSEGKSAVSHMSTAIAQARDFNMGFRELSDSDPTKYTGGSDGNKVFYEISSNPLIARITTTEKSIGQPNIDTPDPNADPVVNPSEPYNMLPYLAIYETDPVESLLDIYWETSDAGLIVDLNAEVASTNGNVTGFSGLTWEFDEDTAIEGQPVTSWFTPVDNQGQTIIAGITAQLTSQSNTNGDVEMFTLVAAPPGPEFGNFQIRYTDTGIVFDSNSASNDVYSFDITVINNNPTEPISTVVTLTGTPGGFGSLRNIAPSFTPIPDKEISPGTEILISEAEWVTANPNNGSILPDNTKVGLRYSFEAFDPVNNVPPANWSMDPQTGVLIQTPGVNALGTYKINVIVADASLVGGGDGSDYESLATEQIELTFTSLPDNVNEGAITELLNGVPNFSYCKVNPVADNFKGQLSPHDIYSYVSMVYYITEDALPGATPPSNPSNAGEAFFDQGIVNPNNVTVIRPMAINNTIEDGHVYTHRIGTDAHRSGTITFSANLTFPPADANETGLERKNITCPSVLYYYRYTGETQWRALPRSIEKNKVGQAGYNNLYSYEYSGGNPVYSPTLDFPYFDSYGATPTSNPKYKMLRNISGTTLWTQAVRAYAYDDFAGTQGEQEEPVGIEYAIVFSGFARGFNSNSFGRPVAWLVADDFNYPKCVPWDTQLTSPGGVNAVIKNGSIIGNSFSTSTYNLFKFYRSDASSNSSEYRKVGTNVADELYGRHPWGDYNDQFYTDTTNFTPFTGTVAEPYHNIRLDRNLPGVDGEGVPFQLHPYSETYLFLGSPTGVFPPNDGTVQPKEINLQWAIGISETGVKLSNPNSTTGVSAIQTSQKFEDPPGVPDTGASGLNEYPTDRGTLRIYRNTYN